MCHTIWLLSRKYGTVWYYPASSKLWYLTALSFVNFQEKLTGTSCYSLRVWSQLCSACYVFGAGCTFCVNRNTPKDWSVKDRTSCTDNLHLGREDDIAKIMKMEGAKCIITWGPTRAKGRPSRAGMGLGRPKPAGLVHSRRRFTPPFPCTRRIFNSKSLEAPPFAKQRAIRTERPSTERRDISDGGSTILEEAPTSGEEGRHRRKGDHDQRCHV
jgi:hypothetical protein